VAAHLCLSEDLMIFAGMSLGYEDKASAMNDYRTPRATVDSFASLIGFD